MYIDEQRMKEKLREDIASKWGTVYKFSMENFLDKSNVAKAINEGTISPAVCEAIGYEKVVMFRKRDK